MKNEHISRLNKLKSYLVKNEIDIGMVMSPANVFYYTGFNCEPHERFMALVIDTKHDEIHLFVPALDLEVAQQQEIVSNITSISDEEVPYDVLQNKLKTKDVSKFGLETKIVNVFTYNHLLEIYKNAHFVDIQSFVNLQRLIKSQSEIQKAQKAVNIIEKVLKEGIQKVEVGMTESDLVGELELLMRKEGADGPSFSSIVLSGEKSALPHGSPGERKLQKGDFLLIDFGVLKDGYCSDITRTFIIGKATEKQREIYNIVSKSTQAGVNAVQSGVPLKNFDLAARKVIEDHGYGQYFNNRVGHGLGIEIHEEPSIHSENETIAEKGMLFTIEPGIYIPSFGGVRIEEEVYINEDGQVEVLTSFPTELQIL